MGFNEKIDTTKLLSSSANISSLWAYDRETSSWVYADKLPKKNNNPLAKSSANAGMWITVNTDMTINMEDYFLSDTENTNTRNYVKSKMITKNRSYFGVRGR